MGCKYLVVGIRAPWDCSLARYVFHPKGARPCTSAEVWALGRAVARGRDRCAVPVARDSRVLADVGHASRLPRIELGHECCGSRDLGRDFIQGRWLLFILWPRGLVATCLPPPTTPRAICRCPRAAPAHRLPADHSAGLEPIPVPGWILNALSVENGGLGNGLLD